MSRKRGMPKRALFAGGSALAESHVYQFGELYSRDPWIYNFGITAHSVFREMQKREFKVRVFRKTKKESFESDLQEYLVDLNDIMLNSILEGNGKMLRHLADIIENFAKESLGPADFERSWILRVFRWPHPRPYRSDMTFPELWENYEKRCHAIGRDTVDPAHFRRIVKNLGIVLKKERAGRRRAK